MKILIIIGCLFAIQGILYMIFVAIPKYINKKISKNKTGRLGTIDIFLYPEKFLSDNNIIIYLSKKIDYKILSDTLIKLGLRKYNSLCPLAEYFYFKLYNGQEIELEAEDYIFRNSITVEDIQNQTLLYISGVHIYKDAFLRFISKKINFYDKKMIDNIEKVLLDNKIIDRYEIYEKSDSKKAKHKIHDADISGIVEKIEYRCEEWSDNSFELALIKHFIKFVMDKYYYYYEGENHFIKNNE